MYGGFLSTGKMWYITGTTNIVHSSEYLLFSVDLLLGPQPGVELPLGTAEADAGGGPEAGRGG